MTDELAGRTGRKLGKLQALRRLWQLKAALPCALVLTGLLVLLLSWLDAARPVTWLAGLSLLVLPLGIGSGMVYGSLRYQAYDAALHPGEGLVLRQGVWWQTETWVPIARLQHLDLQQSPLERLWGMARLVLHTAGRHDHRTVVQGLPLEEAKTLREALMPRVQGRHE